jgi:hypothetical protein
MADERVKRPRSVSFAVDAGTGDFTIAPTTIVINTKKNKRLRWTSKDGPFVLHFNHRSPVGSVVLQSTKLDSGLHEVLEEVEDEVEPGVYEYAVAVAKGDRVFIHSSGEVRVERPHGG